jgi:Uma2 family endonuclease
MTLMDVPVAPPTPAPLPLPAVPTPAPIDGAEGRMTLSGISWEAYVRLNDDVGPGTRITYDRGRMEIVTLSDRHERIKTCLARIIEEYADVAEIDAEGLGGWTMRRQDLDRGLEPDECYYVAHAALILGVLGERRLDLTIDPPPDLAIEVDISPPDVAKAPIYAALGVPEIWRYDGRALTYLARQTDGGYIAVDRSPSFPDLPAGLVTEALAIGLVQGQRAAAAEVRRRVAGRPQS